MLDIQNQVIDNSKDIKWLYQKIDNLENAILVQYPPDTGCSNTITKKDPLKRLEEWLKESIEYCLRSAREYSLQGNYQEAANYMIKEEAYTKTLNNLIHFNEGE
jgi:hypothetical protein